MFCAEYAIEPTRNLRRECLVYREQALEEVARKICYACCIFVLRNAFGATGARLEDCSVAADGPTPPPCLDRLESLESRV
jgi:hypothetical protein